MSWNNGNSGNVFSLGVLPLLKKIMCSTAIGGWNKMVFPFSVLILTGFFLLSVPECAKAQNVSGQTNSGTNLSADELVSQLDSKLWVKLPQWYDSKVRNMLETNIVLKNEYNRKFTQDFIISEMQKNWWISKQNQLLFIRSAIYLGMENKELYDGEDGDAKRLKEFEIAVDLVENCGNNYMKWLNDYIKQTTDKLRQNTDNLRQNTDNLRQNTDNLRQNTDNLRQNTDKLRQNTDKLRQNTDNLRQNTDNLRQNTQQTINQTMSMDSVWLKEMTRFYNLYKNNPSSVKPEELSQAKQFANNIILSCKKYGIDYKKLLSPEVRRFYGID